MMLIYKYRTGSIKGESMLNIREIAQLAGVGKSTVSRVINNTGYVSDETREKIEAVMREYEYYPSAVARNCQNARQILSELSYLRRTICFLMRF